jgi:hypothetical protein
VELPEKVRAISSQSEPITGESLALAYESSKGLEYIFQHSKEHGRLRRGFKAFLAGSCTDDVDRKVHDFVRALEALLNRIKGTPSTMGARKEPDVDNNLVVDGKSCRPAKNGRMNELCDD